MPETDHFADSDSRFEQLVQSVTDYAIFMLDPAGVITSWNAGARRLNGYEAHEIIGDHFSRFYSDEDRIADIPALALKTADREGRFEADDWRVRKNGSRYWASVVIDPIREPDGKLVGYAKITRDLTERKRSQEEAARIKEAFFQSQKMEAISKLTEGVAHDFNNLLAVVIGSLHLAERRLKQGVDASALIGNAVKAAERGASLTKRMLAFAHKQELTLEALDLSKSCDGMRELLQRMIGGGVTIDAQIPSGLPKVLADVRQLELAMLNLVMNAQDAMPHGGTITMAAQRESLVIPQDGLECGEYVRFSVVDQGEGMDEHTLAQATEPFFTTKSIGVGTGLGLSMVHGLAHQSGGKLVLKSVKGMGTTAEIWMRVAACKTDGMHDGAAAGELQRSPTTPASLVVLAVDDDLLVLENTATMLTELGYEVLQANSGDQALQILDDHSVDIVITDYEMPRMTGEELTRRILAQRPALPVLMISGYMRLPAGTAVSVPKLGKPFTEQELARAIYELLAHEKAA